MKYFLIALIIFIIAMVLGVSLMYGVSDGKSDLGLIVAGIIFIGVPILILGLIIWAMKDTYKSFKKGKSEVSFTNWILNIIPFRPISTLIRQVYPDEQVRSQRLCFDGIIGFLSSGKTPVNAGYKLNLPFPAFLVETNSSYYIDRRLQQIVNNILLILVVYFLGPFLMKSIGFDDPESMFKLLFYVVSFVAGMQISFALFWQVSRIDVIKKSWLSGEQKGNHLIQLSGKRPKGSQLSLSTDKFVNMGGITLPFKQVFFVI